MSHGLAAEPPHPAPRAERRVEVHRGLAAVERLAGPWNDLAHRRGRHPHTADAVYMRAFWKGFAARDEDLHVFTVWEGEALVALLPLCRSGRVARRWSPPLNPRHTPRYVFPVDATRLDAVGLLLDAVLARGEALELELVPGDHPVLEALLGAARERSLRVVCRERSDDAYSDLPSEWEAFRGAMSSKLRKNTERAERQLAELGALSFAVQTDSEGLDALLRECFELEALGWKGSESHGALILREEGWSEFYSELARGAARVGHLALYTLRLDGRLLAYDYCIRAGDEIDLMKVSFHPEYARYSPGNVLRYRVFRREIELGEVKSYHYGQSSAWKMRWADGARPLRTVQVFRPGARGRLAAMEFPRLARAAGRLRELPLRRSRARD